MDKIAMMPADVNDVDIAFGNADVIPDIKLVPEEFRKNWTRNPWCEVVSDLFYQGGDVGSWVAVEGVDKQKALRHFRAVLGSFAPKHEDKTAICGWMLSMWFTEESVLGG